MTWTSYRHGRWEDCQPREAVYPAEPHEAFTDARSLVRESFVRFQGMCEDPITFDPTPYEVAIRLQQICDLAERLGPRAARRE